MKDLYCMPFVFQATKYEVYQDGRCIDMGATDVQIISKTKDDIAFFHLEGVIPTDIKRNFAFPIYGIEQGDILEDRIQYGRLPVDINHWPLPLDPPVCNIFSNKTCIRFALLSPLRIVEFYGYFDLIGE